ncbi:glucosamine-6-phosphate deaminase [Salipiger mangrovisoli]|uniref:Glucosamine-6-phosphate deaminase n=1 Tax=Salipiger mangrovisoli TaxID=2865933 RepID=A0ABR9XAF7_9RHOB|nr:glucosamine-6-phosphate deaminase [Salipiger mangrovisoli]MBE9640590.1 glucosamine-6-phosphate deaminase [Salipiger mangrovisoli]
MKLVISPTPAESGAAAAAAGAATIREALDARGRTRIILATGASQFEMLVALTATPGIDWSACEVFHLDEYVGMSASHPASFVGYLRSRFVAQVSGLGRFEAIDGTAADPQAEIDRLSAAIAEAPIDVAFIGIGENGHLAFNDPPALFDTEAPYLRVTLDQACRQQQVSEGWFPDLGAVPTEAYTMSIPQILKARQIICTVPDSRKARAVQGAVEGPLTPDCPASALQGHANAGLYLDAAAASLLAKRAG